VLLGATKGCRGRLLFSVAHKRICVEKNKEQAAKKTLTAAVIGGIILLGAVVFVREVVKLVGVDIGGTPGLGNITIP